MIQIIRKILPKENRVKNTENWNKEEIKMLNSFLEEYSLCDQYEIYQNSRKKIYDVFSYAVDEDRIHIIELLLRDKKLNIHKSKSYYHAIKRRNLDILKLFIVSGLDPNINDGNLLYLSVEYQAENIIEYLLYNPNVVITDSICNVAKDIKNHEFPYVLSSNVEIYNKILEVRDLPGNIRVKYLNGDLDLDIKNLNGFGFFN